MGLVSRLVGRGYRTPPPKVSANPNVVITTCCSGTRQWPGLRWSRRSIGQVRLDDTRQTTATVLQLQIQTARGRRRTGRHEVPTAGASPSQYGRRPSNSPQTSGPTPASTLE